MSSERYKNCIQIKTQTLYAPKPNEQLRLQSADQFEAKRINDKASQLIKRQRPYWTPKTNEQHFHSITRAETSLYKSEFSLKRR